MHPKFWVGTFCWDVTKKLRIGTFFIGMMIPFLIGQKEGFLNFRWDPCFSPSKRWCDFMVCHPSQGGAALQHHVESMWQVNCVFFQLPLPPPSPLKPFFGGVDLQFYGLNLPKCGSFIWALGIYICIFIMKWGGGRLIFHPQSIWKMSLQRVEFRREFHLGYWVPEFSGVGSC